MFAKTMECDVVGSWLTLRALTSGFFQNHGSSTNYHAWLAKAAGAVGIQEQDSFSKWHLPSESLPKVFYMMPWHEPLYAELVSYQGQ